MAYVGAHGLGCLHKFVVPIGIVRNDVAGQVPRAWRVLKFSALFERETCARSTGPMAIAAPRVSCSP